MTLRSLLLSGFAALATMALAAAKQVTFDPQTIYNLCQDSVVRITIKDTNGYSFSGAGFFVNDDLHVLTSYHVVSGATQIKVEATGGAAWDVVQVKINKASDLALLRLAKPSGRKPLRYASPAALRPGDKVVLIGGLLTRVAADLSTGTVGQVQSVDGCTLVRIQDLSMSARLGSPVLDSMGRVVAVERSPLQDQPDQPVGVSVLGIGYLGGPIPWTAFAKGVRDAVAASPLPRDAGEDRAAAYAYSQRLAHWLNGVLEARLRWEAAYLNLGAAPPPRDPSILDQPYQGFAAALQEGLDSLSQTDSGSASAPGAGLTDRVATIDRIAKELAASQKLNIRAAQQVDLQQAAIASERAEDARKSFAGAEDNLMADLTGRKDFAWSEVTGDFSAPVMGYLFGRAVFDCLPDPDRPDFAVVGAAVPGSDFHSGDVVEGVAPNTKTPFVGVRNWSDVAAYLAKNRKLTRVYVRVRRGGSHAMFFSRSAKPSGDDD